VLRRLRSGELLDHALDAEAARLPPRERGFLQELTYGSVRLRGRLDHLLGQLVRDGTDSLQPEVLDVLRLGAYQLREMRVPAYAAVSESVELVRAAGAPRAAALVNGVLHALRRRAGELAFPDPRADAAGYLASWGSHPRWLVERWLARWSAEDVTRLVELDNTRPELYVRVVRMGAAEAVESLAALGIRAERVGMSPESLRLPPGTDPRTVLDAVPAVVQDPAASLVLRYAHLPPGGRVLDLCAAPGGKAVVLADTARYVAAADLSPRRLARVRQTVERLGLRGRIGPVVADGRTPPFAPADAVLLDAPCTGTGTLRRHPDGRWRVLPGDLALLVELQGALLTSAAGLVRPGGLLIYSTCSLEPEENEDVVERFLGGHSDFRIETAEGAVEGGLVDGEGRLVVLPQRTGTDGAFAARLRRAS
jgi:16S rRNA (cytosine967-C5)-methyltransferase